MISGSSTSANPVLGTSQEPAARMGYVDGLRGTAMLMVLLYHSFVFFPFLHNMRSHSLPFINLDILWKAHFGVNLFLLLSGFCLYWPFLNLKPGKKEPTLLEFAKRRSRRILPPYYVALALFGGLAILQVVTHHQIYHHHLTLHYLATWSALHLLMLHNMRTEYVVAIDAPLWSLALECQLYVMFPIFVEAYRKFDKRIVLLAVLVLSSAFRIYLQHYTQRSDYSELFVLPYSVFGRCFEFALGMYIASVIAGWHRGGVSPLNLKTIAFLAAMFACSFIDSHALIDVKWGIGFALLILVSCYPGTLLHRLLERRGIVFLGKFSYSTYLIHQTLIMGVGGWILHHHHSLLINLTIVLASLGSILGISYAYHLLFEKPFMVPAAKSQAKR
jgi:peptidoglycan/LPS O-acetylase OafA/YrhL